MTDYGPSVVAQRDGRLKSQGPARIQFEERADLDKSPDRNGNRPVVRGARRCWAIDHLYARGSIEKRQHDAAERYIDDLSRACGGGTGWRTERVAVSGIRAGLSEGQRGAIKRVAAIRVTLGMHADTVFWWVVIESRGVRAFERRHRMGNGTAISLLRAALDQVDAFYQHR